MAMLVEAISAGLLLRVIQLLPSNKATDPAP
jgi:hypothetical protein